MLNYVSKPILFHNTKFLYWKIKISLTVNIMPFGISLALIPSYTLQKNYHFSSTEFFCWENRVFLETAVTGFNRFWNKRTNCDQIWSHHRKPNNAIEHLDARCYVFRMASKNAASSLILGASVNQTNNYISSPHVIPNLNWET